MVALATQVGSGCCKSPHDCPVLICSIINFAMTIPVAIYGFLMFPDTPHTVKAFWLTEEERQLCLTRLPPTEHYVITWARFKASIWKVVTTWRFYLFSALFMISATSFEKTGIYAEFGLWLKAENYPKHLINYYPTISTAVSIVGTYVITVYCDATGHRVSMLLWHFADASLSPT